MEMKFIATIFMISALILNVCKNQETYKVSALLSNSVPLKVFSCDNDNLSISLSAKNALIEAGMTQCMMPFGVLLSADGDMPKSYLEMAGKILAEMLDQNLDGFIDDSLLFEHVIGKRVG